MNCFRIILCIYDISKSRSQPYTRWFKYDRDCLHLFTHKSVPVIFEPLCMYKRCTKILCNLHNELLSVLLASCGPSSSVGIAIGYGLDGPGIEPRWGARFSAPVQTGSGAHPASSTMGTRSFPGVKSGRGMTLTPHPLLVSWS